MISNYKFDIYAVCKAMSITQMKSLGFFNLNDESQATKYKICFENIISGSISDDISAKTVLGYKNHATFLRFKHRFTERVKSYIFLINAHSKSHKVLDEIHLSLWREVALAKILIKSNNGKSAYATYIKAYEKAKEYELIVIMNIVVPSIHSYFAFISPDKKLFKHYSEQLSFTKKQYEKKLLADKYYNIVSHVYVFSDLREKTDASKQSLEFYIELSSMFEEDDFTAFRVLTYQIGVHGYLLQGNIQQAISINRTALKFIEGKPKVNLVYKFMVLKDLVTAHLKAKEYDNVLLNIQRIEALQLNYNFNYFNLQGIKHQVFSIQKDYNSLYSLTQFIINLKELKKFNLSYEQWKIREALMHFLVDVGKVDQELVDSKPLKPFRLRKFVNDFQLYNKDKRGMNITIQVVQLLYFLKDRKYNKVIERLDALNQYTYRYLRNDSTLRSNCFIKMLLKLPEADYNPIRTQRYVQKYLQKLKDNPKEISMQSTEIEVIPYEHLWEIILEIISKKK